MPHALITGLPQSTGAIFTLRNFEMNYPAEFHKINEIRRRS